MRGVEPLCEQAGLGQLSKSTASRIGSELRERFAAFQRRDLYAIQLAALFLDAVFARSGPTAQSSCSSQEVSSRFSITGSARGRLRVHAHPDRVMTAGAPAGEGGEAPNGWKGTS
jgi:hypothetical protein